MAKVVLLPPPAPLLLEVVLDGLAYHVEALPTETMADVRAAILRFIGRSEEEAKTATWPMHTVTNIQVVGNTPVDRCPAWMGFKFVLSRPGTVVPEATTGEG